MPRRGAPRLANKRCARASFEITATYSLPSCVQQGLRYSIKAEFRPTHPIRTRIWQPSAGQYHRPRHVHLGLPLTILTTGLASGTNPSPTRRRGAWSLVWCEWVLSATWSQSYLDKRCTRSIGQAQTGQSHRRGGLVHTNTRRRRIILDTAYW